jgi:hypothetical protein
MRVFIDKQVIREQEEETVFRNANRVCVRT